MSALYLLSRLLSMGGGTPSSSPDASVLAVHHRNNIHILVLAEQNRLKSCGHGAFEDLAILFI